MAANPTPTSNPVLISMADKLARGLETLESEIGIKQNTAAKVMADKEAALAASMNRGQAGKELADARKTYRQVDLKGERVIFNCRARLTQMFGARHNVWWEAAGFPNQSTAVPEVAALRMSLLSYLAIYFEQNPDKASADMGATAEICKAAHEAISDARSAVNHAKVIQRTAVTAMRAAYRKLRKRVRGAIEELTIVLDKQDPRWLTLSLKIPARTSMPQPVESVTVEKLASGDWLLRWPPSPHARRYRVQIRREGLDIDFINLKTVHDVEHLYRKPKPEVPFEVRVIAANRAGEASASPVVKAKPTAAVVPKPVEQPPGRAVAKADQESVGPAVAGASFEEQPRQPEIPETREPRGQAATEPKIQAEARAAERPSVEPTNPVAAVASSVPGEAVETPPKEDLTGPPAEEQLDLFLNFP